MALTKTLTRMMSLTAAVMLGLVLWTGTAHAALKIDITRGTVNPLPIAITPLNGTRSDETDYGKRIADVITADLERTGLFRSIDRNAFIENPAQIALTPRFADWRVIGADALVTGQVRILPDGRLKAEFRLWDTTLESQEIGKAIATQPDNWRRVAHLIADAIYERLTGERGYFDTRIVYVAESGPKGPRRVHRLAIMDQDGANHRYLTYGEDQVLTPRFSPSRQQITYMAFRNNQVRVYILDLETQQQELLSNLGDMNFAPRFSPDGQKIVMSMSKRGNSDIYIMDLRSRQMRRLTDNPAIDTSPSYAPDGTQIVFNSDRGGSSQLYVMDRDGGNVQRITFGEGRYYTPVWSPRGDLIAFTKQLRGTFYIGVIRPDGSGERLLADSFHNEGPTWAPNGRVLMFYRTERTDRAGRGGRSFLYSVDLTGRNERKVLTPGEASDPAWSPPISTGRNE